MENKKTVSTFTIVKNEVEYVGYNIMSVLDYVDEMIFVDGNSTDGTIELVKYIQKTYDKEKKIKLFLNKDCKNLKDDYVRLFNWTLKQCTGEYLWYLHPDMICSNPQLIHRSLKDGLRYSVKMISIAGERKDKVISSGRTNRWHTIYRNKFGLHYYGWYGTDEEDLYFADITGDEHINHLTVPNKPYRTFDTDIELYHYCDTKPYSRRFGRMVKVLETNGFFYSTAKEIAKAHPRVTLETGIYRNTLFKFNRFEGKHPEVFKKYDFSKFKKREG